MNQRSNKSLSYKDAGVDIDAGNRLVERIKSVAQRTRRPEVLTGLGGFGALFELPTGYEQPVLVSGTDGVGTKLKLAMDLAVHDTIGIDLVAMCVNDLIVGGAEPLFFLDYYATGSLSVEIASQVVEGIGRGCELAGCSLVGGETAEMPGMYQGEDYDLAGFCVGIVEKKDILDGSRVQEGDQLLALTSSGPHSNGYSLIRKILEVNQVALDTRIDGIPLKKWLIEPTRIYVKPILELLKTHQINALAHITGGGLTENIPRVLPDDCEALIDCSSWSLPSVFKWLQQQGNIAPEELLTTFNCGIGMVICVSKESCDATIEFMTAQGETCFKIGEIAKSSTSKSRVSYANIDVI